jgi:hypothetical protein
MYVCFYDLFSRYFTLSYYHAFLVAISSSAMYKHLSGIRTHDLKKLIAFAGAVANGRAKFEAQNQKVSPEKPIRFFGSRCPSYLFIL